MSNVWTRTTWAVLMTVAMIGGLACGSSGRKDASPTITAAPSAAVASPSTDATSLAAAAAASPGAKLAGVVLAAGDYPADYVVKRQQPRIEPAKDLPGLTSDVSGFFATSATPAGDEFVNVIAVATDSEAEAAAALAAFAPQMYLPGLTGGATDATSGPADTTGGPANAKAFSYKGTVSQNQGGTLLTHPVGGEALAFTRGRTFVVVVGGAYGATQRRADVRSVAQAIDTRLAAAG